MSETDVGQISNVSDQETIRKLKLILIKEKKLTKENVKRIDELEQIVTNKEKENKLLVEQVTRLSENINLEEENCNDFQSQLEDINETKLKLSEKCNKIINKHRKCFSNLLDLKYDDDLSKITDSICLFLEQVEHQLKGRDVLEDGMNLLSSKNMDLEERGNNQLEQIRHLEEIIEESRNISRELEKERDQLQNELVDLRQRQQEKEGIMEEDCQSVDVSEMRKQCERCRHQSVEQRSVSGLRNEIEIVPLFSENVNDDDDDDDDAVLLQKKLVEYQEQIAELERKLEDIRGENGDLESFHRNVESVFGKLDKRITLDELESKMKQKNDGTELTELNTYRTLLSEICLALFGQNIAKIDEDAYRIREKVIELKEKRDENQAETVESKEDDWENLMGKVRTELNIEEGTKLDIFNRLFNQYVTLKQNFDKIYDNNVWVKRDLEEITKRLERIENDCQQRAGEETIVENLKKEIELLCANYGSERANLLSEHENELNGLREQLEMAQKSVSKNDLINLEMAEIDKTLCNLKNQLANKVEYISMQDSQLKSLKDTLSEWEVKVKDTEEVNLRLQAKNDKLKELVVKSKKELSDIRSEFDEVNQDKATIDSDFERLTCELEQTKILLSETVKTNKEISMNMDNQQKNFETIIRTKESKVKVTLGQLEERNRQLETLEKEFEAYKIKVQTAFNNQHVNKSTFSDFMLNKSDVTMNTTGADHHQSKITPETYNSEIASYKERLNDLEVINNDFNLEIQSYEDRVRNLNEELLYVRHESERYLEKNRLLIKEKNELNVKLKSAMEKLREENRTQQTTHWELEQKFNVEKEKLAKQHQILFDAYKLENQGHILSLTERIENLEKDCLQKDQEVWMYKEKLKSAEEMKYTDNSLSKDSSMPNNLHRVINWSMSPAAVPPPSSKISAQISAAPSTSATNAAAAAAGGGGVLMELERQQGEGMEAINMTNSQDANIPNVMYPPYSLYNDASSSPNKAIGSDKNTRRKLHSTSNNLLPLDQLLNLQQNKHKSEENDDEEEDRIKLLHRTINKYKTELDNYREQMKDSEITIDHLTSQTELLKSELRRVETNMEREQRLQDRNSYEYLKNVVMKLLHYGTGSDERQQLVPVIITLLNLTDQEKFILNHFATSTIFTKPQEGWSSYFSWTGLT